MSQFDFGTIDPNVKTGTQLASDLNQWRTALHSSHAGAARPAYAAPGMLWVDQTSGTDWKLKLATATGDTIIGAINPAANAYTVLHADGTPDAPGMSWVNEPTLGFYRAASNDMRLRMAGFDLVRFSPTSIVIRTNGIDTFAVNNFNVVRASSDGVMNWNANVHEFNVNIANSWGHAVVNRATTSPQASLFYLPGMTSGTRSNGYSFIAGMDGTGPVFQVYGNGGIANYSANNVNFCDAGLKENIAPSPDYTAFVEQLSFKSFNYAVMPQSGTMDDLIAQELEAIAPELTDEAEGTKVIYSHRVQQRINSVIPRLIARIKALEEQLKQVVPTNLAPPAPPA